MLAKIDLWILDNIFQKVADFWTDRTGTSCFRLAVVVAMLFVGSAAWESAASILIKPGIQWFDLIIFPVLSYMIWKILMVRANLEGIMSEGKAMNPEREFYFAGVVRLFVLSFFPSDMARMVRVFTTSPIDWIGVIAGLSDISFVCFFYFIACTPKPPSRLKKTVPKLAPSSV